MGNFKVRTEIEKYKCFLLGLDPNELTVVRNFIDALLSNVKVNGSSPQSTRPHPAMPERRALSEDRYEVGLPALCAEVFPTASDPDENIPVRVIDISPNGCRFVSDVALRPLQVMTLEFHVANNEPSCVLVEVTRTRPHADSDDDAYEVGCRFLNAAVVEEARNEDRIHREVRHELEKPVDTQIVQLAQGPGAEEARWWFESQGYGYEAIESAGALLVYLRENAQVNEPLAVICPASAILRKPRPEWLDKLDEEFPKVILRFNSKTPVSIQHLWTLPPELVLNLYDPVQYFER